MKIKYLAHASFLITSDAGVKIITDPYTRGDKLKYGEIKESADIVTVSHDHWDHSAVSVVGGNPEVVKKTGSAEVKGIPFTGVPAYHDDAKGSSRGSNIMFCAEVDGIRICHLGDLGHPLDDKQIGDLGRVDILLVPVGGFYTIDAEVATHVCQQLKPRVIIPMHYKTDKADMPIAGIDGFLRGKEGVSRLNASEAEFTLEKLPEKAQIVVLNPAL